MIEAFGGAGYVEDTGIPMLLRDAQVFPIWEGTTNVLALDACRAIGAQAAMAALRRELGFILQGTRDTGLTRVCALAEKALERAETWFVDAASRNEAALEAGARRFALTVGRAFELALLTHHAQWALDNERDTRPAAAARRFAAAGVDLTIVVDALEAQALAGDTQI